MFMRLISSAENRDRQGNKRTVEFYIHNGQVLQRIKKNDRVTHDIKYSESIFEEVAEAIIDTQTEVMQKNNTGELPFNPEELDIPTSSKLQMIDNLMSSLHPHEVEELKHSDNQFQNQVVVEALNDTPSDKDVEKIKEDVLQLIYEEYGFDWFTMPQFRQVYDLNYNRSEAYRYLQQLEGRWLRKQTIPEDEREGQTKYQYKLGSSAQRVIQKYGAFDTKEYPVYKKKCKEYNTS